MNTQKDYTDFTTYDMPVEERRALDVGDIFFNQVRCIKCRWLIRSRNRHHREVCKCGAASVDGGSWYSKTSGEVESHVVPYLYQPSIMKDEEV